MVYREFSPLSINQSIYLSIYALGSACLAMVIDGRKHALIWFLAVSSCLRGRGVPTTGESPNNANPVAILPCPTPARLRPMHASSSPANSAALQQPFPFACRYRPRADQTGIRDAAFVALHASSSERVGPTGTIQDQSAAGRDLLTSPGRGNHINHWLADRVHPD